MRDGRIDMRFPHRRFPRTDTRLRSILLHSLHRKGMVCARTSLSFDSPKNWNVLTACSPKCQKRLRSR